MTVVSVIAIAIALLSTIPSFAAESGGWQGNILWSYDRATYTLTIEGQGDISSILRVDEDDYPWEVYMDELKTVIIKEGVTSIGTQCFVDFHKLEKVVLPDSLTEIQDYAFADCTALTDINIPSSVTIIGESAFQYCKIKSVTIGDGTTVIRRGAFQGCCFEDVKLPSTVEVIEDKSFAGCNSMKSINLPYGLKEIGSDAFSGCSSLQEIYIPQTVTSIGTGAFGSCDALTKVAIPEGIAELETFCFMGCDELKELYLPDTITLIGTCAIAGCDKLTDIYFGGTQEQWENVEVSMNRYLDSTDNSNIHDITIHYESDREKFEPAENSDLSGTDSNGQKSPIIPIIIGCVAGVAIITGAVVFIIIKKKK